MKNIFRAVIVSR